MRQRGWGQDLTQEGMRSSRREKIASCPFTLSSTHTPIYTWPKQLLDVRRRIGVSGYDVVEEELLGCDGAG